MREVREKKSLKILTAMRVVPDITNRLLCVILILTYIFEKQVQFPIDLCDVNCNVK